MDISNPLVSAILCALVITIVSYLYDLTQQPEKNKDKGSYLRIFSISGLVIVVINQQITKNTDKPPPKQIVDSTAIHTGNPSF
tara:strand:- start:266 stop:514 length:249 start_codon:yes stop_codon:yes gene_type:complete